MTPDSEPEPSCDPPSEHDGRREEPPETFGPLTLRRYVKDDGRALILYTHPDTGHAEGSLV